MTNYSKNKELRIIIKNIFYLIIVRLSQLLIFIIMLSIFRFPINTLTIPLFLLCLIYIYRTNTEVVKWLKARIAIHYLIYKSQGSMEKFKIYWEEQNNENENH